MLKALDLVAEAMQIEALSKSEDGLDEVLDLLEKGLGHKYLRRVPTGNAAHPYRYVYSATHALVAGSSTPQVGEKVKHEDQGQQGHYEVTHLHDNGEITMKHDVTGKVTRVHKDRLRDMATEQHAGAIRDRGMNLRRVHEQALRTGTPRQQERASAALNAHNQAFEGANYEKQKAHALGLTAHLSTAKFATTHQHLEAVGAHVVAANLAPTAEARDAHMASVAHHGKKLDELKAKIQAHREANPVHPNQAPHVQDPNSFQSHVNAAHSNYTAANTALMADNPNASAAHGAKYREHAAAASKLAHAATSEALKMPHGEERARAHEKAKAMHEAMVPLMQRLGDQVGIRQHKGGVNIARAVASTDAKAEAEKPSPVAASAAANMEAGTAAMAGPKSHEDTVKDFRKHFMGEGTSAPKALQHYDDTKGFKQGVVGDKQTIPREELRAGDKHISNIRAMAKEKGGKSKAIEALKDARDHWRYMSKLHNGRYENARSKGHGKPGFKEAIDEHLSNMVRARGLRDDLNDALQEVRAGKKGEPSPAAALREHASKAPDIREGDSERVQNEKNIRHLNKDIDRPTAASSAAKMARGARNNRERAQKHSESIAAGSRKKFPLGDPEANQRAGMKHGESIFEGTMRDEGEASGKTSEHAHFDPAEHKDLPKGATLNVHAPNAPNGEDFHLYRHEGHGELSPIGDKTSKEVNTLHDLRGHDVRVAEPGDTRTPDIFGNHEAHRPAFHTRKGDPNGDLAKGIAAMDGSAYDDEMRKGAGVLDDGVWKKAKAAALKTKAEGADGFYALVTSIYKKMGGTFSHDSEKAEEAPPMRKGMQLVEVVSARNAAGVAPADDRHTHAGRMRRPMEAEYRLVDSAPALTGPNQGVVRSLAIARVKSEMQKAIRSSYVAELNRLTGENHTLTMLSKQASAYSRMAVPQHLLKSVNVGNPDDTTVVQGAVQRLRAMAKDNPQVRQGLAILKVSPKDVEQVYFNMGLTPERIYTGSV